MVAASSGDSRATAGSVLSSRASARAMASRPGSIGSSDSLPKSASNSSKANPGTTLSSSADRSSYAERAASVERLRAETALSTRARRRAFGVPGLFLGFSPPVGVTGLVAGRMRAVGLSPASESARRTGRS